ncbi:MAG TPA: AAA family ATPase, partial [Spirochaetota bacterium]|nr:AAA family ATPase [Spirochaetota bacterium]
MKKLPIGIQTFKDIRSDDYIYIDKTEIALDIVKSYRYVFLSRPRRFGKSLFLDTLRNIFEGKKELFKGLAIYDKWNWEETYPVIKISFSGVLSTVEDIKAMVFDNLKENEERLKVNCEEKDSVSAYFSQLIRNTHFKYNQKVVILIDEYDKAILDNIDMVERAHEAREFLRGFYSVIKGSDEYIRFAFLTGVTRFSK